RPDSWLAWLLQRIEALHDSAGVARRGRPSAAGMIAVGGSAALGDELRACLEEAKREIQSLRETSQEW
ncbi:MAG: DUF6586 family protein, partial [Billgrantia desiderata]